MKEEWRNWYGSKSSNLTSITTFHEVLSWHCLVFEIRSLLGCSAQIFPLLLSLKQLSPCDRQKLDLDTHFHKAALSFLCSGSVSTSMSHTENEPSHVCQMQGLRKEVTFISEGHEKFLLPEKCGRVWKLLSLVIFRWKEDGKIHFVQHNYILIMAKVNRKLLKMY